MRRIIRAALAAVVVGAVCVVAAPAAHAGTNRYVTTTGTGCPSSPCYTVSGANAAAQPGDTIYVQNGSYAAATISSSGSALGGRIVWRAANHLGALFPSVEITGAYVDFGIENNGFDIGNSTAQVTVNITGNGDYSRVIGNWVHDNNYATCTGNGGAAISAEGWRSGGYNGHHQEIIGNLVEDIGPGSCSTFQGIYVAVPDVKVINNITNNAGNYGVHGWHAATRMTVTNNTIVNGGSCMVIGNGDTGGSLTGNVGSIVRNNICSGNTWNGISTQNASSFTLSHNLFASSCADNCGGTGSMTVASAGLDSAFHLTQTSPASGAGTMTDALGWDIDDNTRPNGVAPDIGADERQLDDTTITVTDDTYVRSDMATTNFNADDELQIDGSPTRRTLLKFSSLPAGIDAVKLRLYVTFSTGQGYNVNADACSWTSSTVTYNTAPAPGTVLASPASDPAGWNEITLPRTAFSDAGGTGCLQITKTGADWGNLAAKTYSTDIYGAQLVIEY